MLALGQRLEETGWGWMLVGEAGPAVQHVEFSVIVICCWPSGDPPGAGSGTQGGTGSLGVSLCSFFHL